LQRRFDHQAGGPYPNDSRRPRWAATLVASIPSKRSPTILRHLAGDPGKLTAIEFDGSLDLAKQSNVVLKEGTVVTIPLDAANVIHVNAGAICPTDQWLDQLKDGGRLILPMTRE
jgi:Protein-L-isoaspartate(D-aspartate) O-methyltransferase (PCMT)